MGLSSVSASSRWSRRVLFIGNGRARPTAPLQKDPSLILDNLHGRRALRVVVSDVIDSSAHGVASHQPGVVGPQHFRHHFDTRHPRIEPQVVTVWIKNNWHTVVNG